MKDWNKIIYFDPNIDNFGDPEKMDPELIYTLDAWRKYVGRPIVIHCGFEERETGLHPLGKAVDCHVEGMSLIDQFVSASRFLGFRGIGIYPWWNNPGLHVDSRMRMKNQPRSLWGSVGHKKYVPLNSKFLKGV